MEFAAKTICSPTVGAGNESGRRPASQGEVDLPSSAYRVVLNPINSRARKWQMWPTYESTRAERVIFLSSFCGSGRINISSRKRWRSTDFHRHQRPPVEALVSYLVIIGALGKEFLLLLNKDVDGPRLVLLHGVDLALDIELDGVGWIGAIEERK